MRNFSRLTANEKQYTMNYINTMAGTYAVSYRRRNQRRVLALNP